MILVAGGTGRLGRELVPLLLGAERRVRVLTRNAERARTLFRPETELAVGDVTRAASLSAALTDVDVVVSAITGFGPGGAGSSRVDLEGNLNLIRAAEEAGVRHFVLLSMHGAAADHPMELLRKKFRAEQALRASRMSWTIVRPTVFMELWAGILGDPIRRNGKTVVFGRGDNPVNFVSVRDLARFVQVAVNEQSLRGQALSVGGPENLSFNQVVRSFELLGGRPVAVRHIPRPVMRLASLLLHFVRPDLAGMVAAGLVMDETDMSFDATGLQRAYPTIELTRLETVAREIFTSVGTQQQTATPRQAEEALTSASRIQPEDRGLDSARAHSTRN